METNRLGKSRNTSGDNLISTDDPPNTMEDGNPLQTAPKEKPINSLGESSFGILITIIMKNHNVRLLELNPALRNRSL